MINNVEVDYMRTINSIDELNLPEKYKEFIIKYLSNIENIDYVDKIVLFGSCAKGNIHKYSDIDIFVITKKEITIEEEFYITCDLLPAYDFKFYVPTDIIVQSKETFERYKTEFGMIQKQVEKDGVILNGLLQSC